MAHQFRIVHPLKLLPGLAAATFVIGCCPPKQVNSFAVQPQLACPGQRVTVQWDVSGRASLKAIRDAHDWDDGEVPSKGVRTFVPAATTSFTITALDANRADGNSSGTKAVQVADVSKSIRGGAAVCDAASNTCKSKFTLATGTAQLRVASVSAPTIVRTGTVTAASLTVSHGAWNAHVPANGEVAADVPAEGEWTLAAGSGPVDQATPQPQMRVTLTFSCSP